MHFIILVQFALSADRRGRKGRKAKATVMSRS